jgi:uncharacterized Fe-S center protein
MKKLLLACCLVVGSATFAQAATIKLDIGNQTKSWTISPADIQRILDALKRDTNNPALTNAEAFAIIGNRFINLLNEGTKNSERGAAVIPPLDITDAP